MAKGPSALSGSRLVSLTAGGNDEHYMLDRPEIWKARDEAQEFAPRLIRRFHPTP